MSETIDVKENIRKVKENMRNACLKAGRTPEDTTLIAVTKTKPFEMLMEAYDAGVRDFGENKVQDLMAKFELAPKDSRFHMIGHLQKNKVKYLIGNVYLIHGVDSYELAEVIDKESKKKNVVTNILVEVNVAGEESKFGTSSKDAKEVVKKIASLPNVKVKGLMTIAPYVVNPEENRQYFVELRNLLIDINKENIDNISMDILSMGMTGDYCVACEEGATYVRVGTGIFGERDYGKENCI
ncbi:MAG: YggS family pyridoxal phosphate-dependent enzyme [Lachnospiraceae bacterium]|nr:YggS family pyridoxal phosphate-dependent enzyme [Lachnospiraceae bacterium]